VEAAYDFTARPLSATALRHFLECPRRFYHRYVEGLKEHDMPQEMPEEHEIGTALHAALRDVYADGERHDDPKRLKAAVAEALVRHSGDTPLERFLQQLWLRRLEPFFALEAERAKTVRAVAVEKRFRIEHRGFVLEGQIDRIDAGPEGLEVLDYKSGKYPLHTPKNVDGATDFQLEFYHLAASREGEVAYCGYYDLAEGKIVPEALFERKMALLDAHLDRLRGGGTLRFERTDDLKRCRYCPYAAVCGREPA
jgi:RecB family exonuclease